MQLPRTSRLTRTLASFTVIVALVAACTSDTSNDDAATDDAGAQDDQAANDASDPDADADAEPAEPALRFDGPEDGTLVGAADLEGLSFTVTAEDDEDHLDDLVLLLDGDDVTADAEVRGATLTYEPGELPDGERTLVVAEDGAAGDPGDGAADGDTDDDPGDESDGDAADGDAAGDDAAGDDVATDGNEGDQDGGGDEAAGVAADADDLGGAEPLHTWRFEVKLMPPTLELTSPDGAVRPGDDVTVAGTTDPGATVAIGDEEVTADDTGAFELELAGVDDPPTIVVTDRAGNTTEVDDAIVFVASRVEVDEIRTVHATFWAWATPSLRDPISQMIDDGRINALQLDLKDEGGHIGYDSQVPLAQDIGAGVGPLDLEQTVADLHERDVAVIGRIVAFADPTLAEWAWANGERDWVIQVPDGSDYYRGSYAGFSNYTHQDVIDYLLDIAEEAAAAGVDHIMWDYIRRPEGMDNYTVPGLTTTPEEAIADFARQADERLAPYGVQHAAAVYGIAADRPTQIGQDIPMMAEHLDYVSPMIYPSHWGAGEYDVADPNRQPYDIVSATLEVWQEVTEGKRARVVPWLEDTPYRAWDRPHQVREQIRAARDQGIDEWLMWNPGSTFTPAAYERRE